MNLLAVDYGEKYIGIAIAQTPLAEPVVTVEKSHVTKKIIELIDYYQIDTLIVGISEGSMADKSRQFGNELHQLTGLPVKYVDETLTSSESRLQAAKAGFKKSKREAKIDHYAAALFLQDYIDNYLKD
jgi:putative Holliday junction resolvase